MRELNPQDIQHVSGAATAPTNPYVKLLFLPFSAALGTAISSGLGGSYTYSEVLSIQYQQIIAEIRNR